MLLELQSTRLSWFDAVEQSPGYLEDDRPIATGQMILDRIKERAIARWGEEKWLANLVREYVKIAIAQGDEKATTVNRRPQIDRAFTVGSCTLETAIWLAAAVGCRFQLACVAIEVEEF